jgi:hypothetical protein
MSEEISRCRARFHDGGIDLMLTDPYNERWLNRLNVSTESTQADNCLYLLVDGVFVPGLHRLIKAALPYSGPPTLLFEALPGCNDKTRDVSPFLIRYHGSNAELNALLGKCSGFPMISAIETVERQADLTERLAAWCVVRVDGHHYNFRFPDTRRLPGIFDALMPQQRSELTGPATRWSYMDRSGLWKELAISGTPNAIAEQPTLNEQQFAELVSDSEVDEVIAMLQYRGLGAVLHSQCYSIVSLALSVAIRSNLDMTSKLSWCESCLLDGLP